MTRWSVTFRLNLFDSANLIEGDYRITVYAKSYTDAVSKARGYLPAINGIEVTSIISYGQEDD